MTLVYTLSMNIFFHSFLALLLTTVQPEEDTLARQSHLIALGQISSVSEHTKEELEVTIQIKKVIKGTHKAASLSFYYPNQLDKGHRFKSCIGKKTCSDFANETRKFYLLNRDQNTHFQKMGLKGWQLVDAWFGITSP
jgi:hypothetical protein